MGRPIDADALKAMFPVDYDNPLYHFTGIWAAIDVQPTIEAEPVKRGEWKIDDDWSDPYCTECGCIIPRGPANYCPNCGAHMKEG